MGKRLFLLLAILFDMLSGHSDLAGEVWEATALLALAAVFLVAWLIATNRFGIFEGCG